MKIESPLFSDLLKSRDRDRLGNVLEAALVFDQCETITQLVSDTPGHVLLGLVLSA